MATKLNPRHVHVDTAELKDTYPDFYSDVQGTRLWPLWEEMNTFANRTEPGPGMAPALWRYGDVRPLVMRSGHIISAEKAERRVLALMNPGLKPHMAVTPTIYAGYQLVMPGEVAPTHRHSPAAFRFILEGGGAYTAVNGERTYMYPGDFVVTPSLTWHDHGNETDEPMIWLDGLDWPLTNKLTGDDAIPTLSAFIQLLPAGFRGAPYRQTDASVYSVIEGSGHTEIGDILLEWGPKDTFAVPIWAQHRHIADGEEDVVLFSFSDRGLQEKLGLWREQRPGG